MHLKSFFVSVLLFISLLGYSQTVVIPASNTGLTGASASLHRKPLGSYYGFERSAFIYTPAELGITDTVSIQSIAFYVDSINSSIAANTPVKVYMKDITDTVFIASTTTANELNGATLVYDAGLVSGNFVDENWITINLFTPFIHYADKSLEIIIETNAGGTGNEASGSKGFRYNEVAVKRFQYWQQDNTAPGGTGTLDTLRPNITINYSTASICNGTPVAGMALPSDSNVCVNSNVSLILTGNNPGALVTYQWQTSPDGITYTNVSGANQQSYMHTITALTYFRGIVSCGVNSDTSSTRSVGLLLPVYCYCNTNIGGGCTGYSIDSLSIGGTGFNASLNGCENISGPHYSAYDSIANYTATLTAGQTYTLTIRQTGNNITSLWIDYNHDGVFGNTEWTQINTTSATNGITNKTFTVPATAYNGLTGMRVRTRASGVLNDSTAACTGFTTGETEDFLISITGGGTIGISDYSSTTDVRLFPNPNTGNFSIETKNNATPYLIEVRNILGTVVLSGNYESADGKITIDLHTASGVYFVKGLNTFNRSAFTKKIIIE